MKTLVSNDTGHSKYVFEDSDVVTLTATYVDCPACRILDLNSGNATMHEGVTPPGDWFGDKYFFDGVDWTLDPDFAQP